MNIKLGRWIAGGTVAIAAFIALPVFAQVPMTEGEVRKVDKDNQKLTLKHGEIKNLDMPPMTMVFGVKDPSVLDKLNVGDKVQFLAASEAGKFVVTEIQPSK
jgi:Cu(I)/Ag(I) efflux system periplasmic protein CusF